MKMMAPGKEATTMLPGIPISPAETSKEIMLSIFQLGYCDDAMEPGTSVSVVACVTFANIATHVNEILEQPRDLSFLIFD